MHALFSIVVLLLGWLTVSPVADVRSEEVSGQQEAERSAVFFERERASGSVPLPKKRLGEPGAFIVPPAHLAIPHLQPVARPVGPSAGFAGLLERRRLRSSASPRGPPHLPVRTAV